MIEIQKVKPKEDIKVFHFWDMHSGGRLKTKYEHIYIDAYTKDEAIDIFMNMFNQNPLSIYCECCGENFSISQHDDLESATEFQRNEYRWRSKLVPMVEEYLNEDNIFYLKRTEDV